MICIGIDPGLTGAISFIDSRGTCVIEDLPTMTLPGNGMIKRKIDGRALADLVHRHCALGDGAPMVLCEQVRAMGGKNNAVQTQGSLMRTLGAVEAVLEVLRYPPTMVEPQTWKRFYGLGKEKPEAMEKARALYPSAANLLRRVKDHNRAESLLIAHWGMRNLT